MLDTYIYSKLTRDLLKSIGKEENDLMDELKAIAKSNPDFDEEPLKAKAQQLITRRKEVNQMLEEQTKFSAGIYQYLDQKIKRFGKCLSVLSMTSSTIAICDLLCLTLYYMMCFHILHRLGDKACISFISRWGCVGGGWRRDSQKEETQSHRQGGSRARDGRESGSVYI